MGPNDIKEDVYNVMTNSRELTNYCQESVRPIKSKKISDSLDNFSLNIAVDFLTKSLIDKDNLFEESENINFDKIIDEEDYPIYNKVMSIIENYFVEFRL